MTKIGICLTMSMFIVFVVVGCMGKTQDHQQSVSASATIGTAKMLKGGTIIVKLHGESGGRMREIKYELKPGNPGYQEFKRNIGGIKVGEEKLIFPPPESPCVSPNIGTAKMLQDGTIVLHIRGETNGMTAEKQYEVKPGDPSYKSTLNHLGGLKPGEVKPVPPWLGVKRTSGVCTG